MAYSSLGSTTGTIQQAIFQFQNEQTHPASVPIPRHRSATITSRHTHHINTQGQSDQLDLLQVLDPAVNAASTLTHIRNSLFVPPMVNHYGTPTIEISEQQPHLFHSHHTDPPTSKHRLQVLKRLAEGVRAFIITPIGIIITIYGILVVFWGAALVLILLGWLKITPHEKYRLWVEICSQVLNGLFTIPGLGLFPSRIIDSFNIAIILHYARVIWKRQGRKNLEDPNDLIPPKQTSPKEITSKQIEKKAIPEEGVTEEAEEEDEDEERETSNLNNNQHDAPQEPEKTEQGQPHQTVQEDQDRESGLVDVWKDDQEIVLNEKEIERLRTAQESLCHSQTWYRPHSSATHYAFPIRWAVVILILNLGNSLFQAALCAVMWGLRYSTRPAWTTATFMALSFSCGITSGLLIWRIGLRTLKTQKVAREVSNALRPTRKDKLRRAAVRTSFEVVHRIKQRARVPVHHHRYQHGQPDHQRKRSSNLSRSGADLETLAHNSLAVTTHTPPVTELRSHNRPTSPPPDLDAETATLVTPPAPSHPPPPCSQKNLDISFRIDEADTEPEMDEDDNQTHVHSHLPS
ncbi:hypothetical protein PCANC_16318 [Puccinia coronata f. sp. avenae]|uniref:Uncharacterized protein n=1 Tax=Puccinia coronata f. sp. avenae TaxID=200324 RepID=A0A2N5SK64_9BASI|nr:hypothetical protein PCANC_16318 [Puccinia coronata f. sp. avenae]